MEKKITIPNGETKIFISYRRVDSEYLVKNIHDIFSNLYGRQAVFMDTDSIPYGEQFPEYIVRKITESKVFLLVIGKTFLTARNDDGGLRLFGKDDFLRLEIETALNTGTIIIPLLENGATYPSHKEQLPESMQKLITCNALPLGISKYWDERMAELSSRIEQILGIRPVVKKETTKPAGNKILVTVMVLLLLAIGGFAFYKWNQKLSTAFHIRFDIAGIKPATDISHYHIKINALQMESKIVALVSSNGEYYAELNNISPDLKGSSFSIEPDEALLKQYNLLTSPGKIYLFTDTSYLISLAPTEKNDPATTKDLANTKSNGSKTNNSIPLNNMPVQNPTGDSNTKQTASSDNAACSITGVKFIDAETYDDNLTFTEGSKNNFYFSGYIGHSYTVSGNAVLKRQLLTLKGDDVSGTLVLEDCRYLRGTLKTKNTDIQIRVNFIRK